MKTSLFLIAFISLFSIRAQFTNVLISQDYNPNEPSIAIDPENTDRLVAGANLNSYYFSEDGGETWVRGTLQSSSYGVWGDPCLLVDNNGDYYYFHLSSPPYGQGDFIDRIVCQKFSAGTWDEGSFFGLNGKDQDKEWAVFDRVTGNIYACWTEFDQYGSNNSYDKTRILFVKSEDLGQTWSAPVKINETDGGCTDDDNTVEGAVPAVGPNGEIYVAWSGPAGIQFTKSTDYGQTWSPNVFVDPQPGGWDYDIPGIYRANGLPVTLCDTSGGPYHGTIYINWSDQRNGMNDTDIWLKKSTDGGATWSEAIRVNNDTGSTHQFLSWMTIDQTTGYLYAVFYDRRSDDGVATDVYLARSTNGGETFSNYKINELTFYPQSNIFFGDYINIAAHDGVIRPVWMTLNNGQLKLFTALINEDMFVSVPDANHVVDLHRSYPNPATGKAYIPFKIYRSGTIDLYLSDAQGNRVAQLVKNRDYTAGKHIYTLDIDAFRLSPGLYFYTLVSENTTLTGKLWIK